MAEELSKRQYKIAILILKYFPLLVGICCFISVIASCFCIQLLFLSNMFFISPIWCFIFAYMSYAFKCCIWHRLPLYYCIVLHGISLWDYYLTIPLTNSLMLFVYLFITIVFILLGMYFKNKYNVERKNGKRSSI